MTVKELISQLSYLPEDAEVLICVDNGYDYQTPCFQYYEWFYATDYDRNRNINFKHHVVVHSC